MIYKGRAATTGNSQSMAFERALFRAHPEFASGRLEAQPISAHYMLVRAVPDADADGAGEDPVLDAYLEFLQEQMKLHPESIQGLSADSLERARELVGNIEVDPDEDLGDDVAID
jgi:hypothetical protein